jgi:hypothetical protein
MNRSISVMIEANELHSLEAADLIVSVDLSGFASTNYAASVQIIGRGYEGARKKSQLLAKLALDEVAWQQHMGFRESRRIRSTPPRFHPVSGTGPELSGDREEQAIGKPLDPTS